MHQGGRGVSASNVQKKRKSPVRDKTSTVKMHSIILHELFEYFLNNTSLTKKKKRAKTSSEPVPSSGNRSRLF